MAEEFEFQDLSDAAFWGVDLSRARFRDVDLSDVTISHARIVNVEIDGFVDHVVINGVDVTGFVNDGDVWFPLRAMLRPTDPTGLRAAWDALEQSWSTVIHRATRLGERRLHERVDGEWSFVETLRHLLFGMDKWFTLPVLGERDVHSFGLSNAGSADFGWPGLDNEADPTLDDVLSVRAARAGRFRAYLDTVTPAELTRTVEVLENGTTEVAECLFTVFEEAFEHLRYATRDLQILERSTPGG